MKLPFGLFRKNESTFPRLTPGGVDYSTENGITIVVIPPRHPEGFQQEWLNEAATYNFPYFLEREYILAEREFNRGEIESEPSVPFGPRTQWIVDFDPQELSLGLSTMWQVNPEEFPGKKVDVPGAYVGKFAQGLENVGFDVTAYDPVSGWVEHLTAIGLNARRGIAQDLPQTPGKYATLMFELFPVTEGNWYLAFLREIACSERGVACVESKQSFIDNLGSLVEMVENSYYNGLRHTSKAFINFANLFGLTYCVVDTDNFRFHGYRVTDTSKVLAKRDLGVLGILYEVFPQNEGIVARLSLEDMARELDCTIMEVVHSLNRTNFFVMDHHGMLEEDDQKPQVYHKLLQPFNEAEAHFYLHQRHANGDLVKSLASK